MLAHEVASDTFRRQMPGAFLLDRENRVCT